jgi:anaerobic ribonucleoside-triphosphate reductase activating protein
MKIRLAAECTVDSIVDGPGLRTTVWTQGCKHDCKECHNPSTHDMNGGYDVDVDDLVNFYLKQELQSGVTLSGGDPFYQPEALLELTSKLKKNNVNIWCYTGFVFEDLMKDDVCQQVLKNIDVLVDGPFVIAKKSLALLFRGSENQRLINVQSSLKENKVVLYEE